jgi:tetratricopeptide (TPR) repeat protein
MNESAGSGARTGGVNFDGSPVNTGGGDVVGRDKHVHEAPLPVVPALHQLPPAPPDFTGRAKELAELSAALQKAGVHISGLQGLGGVGKTTLALKLAEMLAGQYPDAQFYLDLKGTSKQPVPATAAMAHVIRAYHPTMKLAEDPDEVAALYRSVLHNQRALILLDNAKDRQQVEPLIPPQSCILLVTSRQKFTLPGLVAKNLDALTAVDARDLLLRVAYRLGPEHEKDAERLVELCGYLPLAIRAVGSALQEREDLRPNDYADKLADARERLKLTETEASLQLSYDLLPEDLARCFRKLAVFPGTFAADAAATVWEMEPGPAGEALGTLLRYSLLLYDSSKNRYRQHDLVRLFADSRLTGEDREAAEIFFSGHYAEVASQANQLFQNRAESLQQGLALFDLEWPNIKAGQSWAAACIGMDPEVASLALEYQNAAFSYLQTRLHVRERLKWVQPVLDAARKAKDELLVAQMLQRLAGVLKEMGKAREALKTYNEALTYYRKKEDQGGEWDVLVGMASAYRAAEDPERAIECYTKCLESARQSQDRFREGLSLWYLGLVYEEQDDFTRAIENYQQVAEIERERSPHGAESTTQSSLGRAFAALGKYREALGYYQKALDLARLSKDRKEEGRKLAALGSAYSSLNEMDNAVSCFREYLGIAREIGDRGEERSALWYLGLAYNDMKKTKEAVDYSQQALEIAHEIGDFRGEMYALSALARAYRQAGDGARAIEYYEKELAISREIGERISEGKTLYSISLILADEQEYEKAIARGEQSIAVLEGIKSPKADEVRERVAEWRKAREKD